MHTDDHINFSASEYISEKPISPHGTTLVYHLYIHEQ